MISTAMSASRFSAFFNASAACPLSAAISSIRLKTLGADYTEEAIRERIAGRRTKAAKAPREQRGVSLLIDIENSIKAAQSRGYEQWAKIHNLRRGFLGG